jgi:putative transcriptional regulator
MKNKVEVHRKKHDINQDELAKAMKVSRQTISSIENGRYNPSVTLAYKLAKYFQVSIEVLFEFEEENNE